MYIGEAHLEENHRTASPILDVIKASITESEREQNGKPTRPGVHWSTCSRFVRLPRDRGRREEDQNAAASSAIKVDAPALIWCDSDVVCGSTRCT